MAAEAVEREKAPEQLPAGVRRGGCVFGCSQDF